MDSKIALLLIASMMATIVAQKFEFGGGCPSVPSMTNFDMGKFLGKWYEILKHPLLLDLTGKCASQTIMQNFFIQNLEYKRINFINNENLTNTMILVPTSLIPNKGDFAAILQVQAAPIPIPYGIIDTDYTTYAIVNSCADFGMAKLTLTWVFSRIRNPGDEFISFVNTKLEARNISTDLTKVDQINCPLDF